MQTIAELQQSKGEVNVSGPSRVIGVEVPPIPAALCRWPTPAWAHTVSVEPEDGVGEFCATFDPLAGTGRVVITREVRLHVYRDAIALIATPTVIHVQVSETAVVRSLGIEDAELLATWMWDLDTAVVVPNDLAEDLHALTDLDAAALRASLCHAIQAVDTEGPEFETDPWGEIARLATEFEQLKKQLTITKGRLNRANTIKQALERQLANPAST